MAAASAAVSVSPIDERARRPRAASSSGDVALREAEQLAPRARWPRAPCAARDPERRAAAPLAPSRRGTLPSPPVRRDDARAAYSDSFESIGLTSTNDARAAEHRAPRRESRLPSRRPRACRAWRTSGASMRSRPVHPLVVEAPLVAQIPLIDVGVRARTHAARPRCRASRGSSCIPACSSGRCYGVRSSSHARALFRKSLESSAPTGQRSTTLRCPRVREILPLELSDHRTIAALAHVEHRTPAPRRP